MVTPLKTDTLIASRKDPETGRYSRVGRASSLKFCERAMLPSA